MTTHAMEEAELLSDKLAVLNHGEVRCVGTPLQLKNLLGKGYRVSLVCNKKHINLVKNLFKTVVPSSEFYESSGDSGSLLYNIPLDKVKELGSVFKLIDSKKKTSPDDEEEQTVSIHERKALINLKKLVKDVGVSQTTLEEVFMAATEEI
jgi:ABC-type multidrug transport system ATPase subunit